MSHKLDLIGKVIGQLTVISRAADSNDSRPRYNCICICGNNKIVSARNLQRGATTHCGCIKRERSIRNPDAALNGLIWVYISNAKKRSLDCTLTKEEFIELFSSNCYYCNAKPSRVYKKDRIRTEYIYNGIDRTNNDKGYITGNVVSCCTSCNYMKGEYSKEEFIDIISKIYNNLNN